MQREKQAHLEQKILAHEYKAAEHSLAALLLKDYGEALQKHAEDFIKMMGRRFDRMHDSLEREREFVTAVQRFASVLDAASGKVNPALVAGLLLNVEEVIDASIRGEPRPKETRDRASRRYFLDLLNGVTTLIDQHAGTVDGETKISLLASIFVEDGTLGTSAFGILGWEDLRRFERLLKTLTDPQTAKALETVYFMPKTKHLKQEEAEYNTVESQQVYQTHAVDTFIHMFDKLAFESNHFGSTRAWDTDLVYFVNVYSSYPELLAAMFHNALEPAMDKGVDIKAIGSALRLLNSNEGSVPAPKSTTAAIEMVKGAIGRMAKPAPPSLRVP